MRLLAVAVLVLVAAPSGRAQTVSDADLRGFKGGLVELELNNGTTVRGMLYGFTGEHMELEVAGARTVKLHRSWVKSIKAAPQGIKKSATGDFPPDGGMPYSARSSGSSGDARPAERPRTSETPADAPAVGTPSGAPVAPRPVAGGSGPLAKGLVFQLKMGGNLLSVMGGGIAAWLNSSFMFGFKTGSITIGLGLEMTYNDDNQPNMTPDPIESSTAMVLFQPTLEYILALKGALALYLSAGLHVGFVNNHMDPGADFTDPMLGFHAGLGMRYFFHPRFAVGIEGGLRGAWILLANDEDVDEDDEHTGTMTIYGAATLTAIW